MMIFAMIAFSENGAFAQKNITTHYYMQKTTAQLLKLEKKSMVAEFALDTAFLSSVIYHTCLSICEEGVHGKQAYLSGMCHTISQRNKDSLFVDSFKLENAIVHLYGNTSVVTFVVHSYRKSRGIPNERKTRFYDVWVTRKAG